MLKTMVDRKVIFVAFVVLVVLGVFSKCVANRTVNRLLKASENMSKSNHAFIRLIRAKFEHACMISDRMENVEVFVDKYIYDYRVMGIRLHSLRRLEWICALLCVIVGVFGGAASYACYGMSDQVLQSGGLGCAFAILIYLFSITTDENFRLEMARNYIVDYLENVCLHKYEKANQKQMQAEPKKEIKEKKDKALPIEESDSKEKQMEEIRPKEEPVIQPFPQKQQETEEEDKEILIRKILEEFMA